MRKKTYLKAKNVQNFTAVLRLSLPLEFTDNFGSHFIGRGLTDRSKS